MLDALDFTKKKTLQNCVFGVIRNHPENNSEKSLNFGKLHKNKDKWGLCHFFFAIADLKFFSRCNVIQQIKKTSPKTGFQS